MGVLYAKVGGVWEPILGGGGGAGTLAPSARINLNANTNMNSGWAGVGGGWVTAWQQGSITPNPGTFGSIDIVTPGIYLVNATGGWGAGAGTIGRKGAGFYLNGVFAQGTITFVNTASGFVQQCIAQVRLVAGDRLQMVAYHDSATVQPINAGVATTFLEVVKVDSEGPAGPPGAGTSITPRQYTASGTWTKPAGLVALLVEVVGGGGGGGGAAPSAGSRGAGGGGGGYLRTMLTAADLSGVSTVAVTVGAGSGGGGSGTNGGTGTATSFGSFAVGNGGAGGTGGTGPGATGSGGAGGTVTSTIPTALGVTGQAGSPGIGVTSPLLVISGGGGNSGLGMGGAGRALASGSSLAGLAAPGWGGGGGGGCAGTATAVGGGAGGDGIVLLTEYVTL